MSNNSEKAERIAVCLYYAVFDIYSKECLGLHVLIRNNLYDRLIIKGTFQRDVKKHYKIYLYGDRKIWKNGHTRMSLLIILVEWDGGRVARRKPFLKYIDL